MLKHAAPVQWEQFIAAIGVRADSATSDSVEAVGGDAVFRAQGRAREIRDLLVLLRDADKTVAAYEASKPRR